MDNFTTYKKKTVKDGDTCVQAAVCFESPRYIKTCRLFSCETYNAILTSIGVLWIAGWINLGHNLFIDITTFPIQPFNNAFLLPLNFFYNGSHIFFVGALWWILLLAPYVVNLSIFLLQSGLGYIANCQKIVDAC